MDLKCKKCFPSIFYVHLLHEYLVAFVLNVIFWNQANRFTVTLYVLSSQILLTVKEYCHISFNHYIHAEKKKNM